MNRAKAAWYLNSAGPLTLLGITQAIVGAVAWDLDGLETFTLCFGWAVAIMIGWIMTHTRRMTYRHGYAKGFEHVIEQLIRKPADRTPFTPREPWDRDPAELEDAR